MRSGRQLPKCPRDTHAYPPHMWGYALPQLAVALPTLIKCRPHPTCRTAALRQFSLSLPEKTRPACRVHAQSVYYDGECGSSVRRQRGRRRIGQGGYRDQGYGVRVEWDERIETLCNGCIHPSDRGKLRTRVDT